LAIRLNFDDGARLDFTEQGKRKGMALWITGDPESLERVQRLGPEVDAVSLDNFAEMLSATSSRLKTVLTDQTTMAGIGNAWSDEVLHRAQLSPFVAANKLDTNQVGALYEVLGDARTALAEVSYVGRLSVWAVAGCRGAVNSTLVTETHLDGDLPICDFAVLDVPADGLNLKPIQVPQ